MSKTILSLCDYSGAWSQPYHANGYHVVQVDIQHGFDVRTMQIPQHGHIHGVLAAPPCTMFCVGSAHLWAKRTDEQMREALSVVDACVRIAYAVKPQWWCLENPQGQLCNWLGPHVWAFHPCQYGDEHRKHTYLWGNFTPPMFTHPYAKGRSGVVENAKSEKGSRQNARSKTPEAFARAFFEANP